jgi:hypothetical protein
MYGAVKDIYGWCFCRLGWDRKKGQNEKGQIQTYPPSKRDHAHIGQFVAPHQSLVDPGKQFAGMGEERSCLV